jgi:hypothetical protein
MTDLFNRDSQGKNAPSDSLKWFAPSSQNTSTEFLHYFDTLANAPRKVDLLLRADEATALAQSDILQRLAQHPKLGTLIVFGMPPQQRLLMKARAAMYGLHTRFVENEDELRVVLHKRRSHTMPGGASSLAYQ